MKKSVLTLFTLSIILITGQLAFTYSSSAPPPGMTNAPGESECTACHTSFPLITSGTLWNNITLTTSVALSSLQPNTTYSFNLTFSNPTSTKYGFELVALPSLATASSLSIGTMAVTSLQTELTNVSGRQYMSHSASGTSAPTATKTWTFNYTTPATMGGINFYLAVNSTNSDGTNSGDRIYVKVFSSNVLPVKWMSYGVKAEGDVNTIEWTTACEIDNAHFEIERSEDATQWEVIGKVKSKGNSNSPTEYLYTDRSVSSANLFYRIKQVDFNGAFEYSKVLTANQELAQEQVSYNAEQRTIHIHNISHMGSASLFTLAGNPVATSSDGTDLNVSSLDRGIYVLQLPSGNYQKIFVY
ncbi:MAG: choice-of-anchor V domain-containing protein [Bacteroidota bacterium]